VVALGCAPGLGFVHTGHDRSFVYDIADLYKADTSIPVAFDVAANGSIDIGATTRRAMRDVMFGERLIERCVGDVRTLLGAVEFESDDGVSADVVALWNETGEAVGGGRNYDGDVDW
jgi:CRISPR-associated protein Cas1